MRAPEARKIAKDAENTWTQNDIQLLELILRKIESSAYRGEYNIRSFTFDTFITVRKISRYLNDNLGYRCSIITFRNHSNNDPHFQIEIDWSGI